ncbi:MBL fold metallo-hydrolase [Orrella sp. JC864]|uniref:MBL fold metallo-hydrolase n=1 Tax=Orrella sp. JC864 TaxID=3120298 RepID=UPI00300BDD47
MPGAQSPAAPDAGAHRPAPACRASLTFVNHASVLLSDGQVGVLTDPWYFGEAFHRGWSLLAENGDAQVREVLARTHYIWISHEHPDHFSPPFFVRYGELLREAGVRILFQRTRDGRVAAYLRSRGFQVTEMRPGRQYRLGARFSVSVAKSDLYDSALLAQIDGLRIFNLNDCPIGSHAKLARFVARHGRCDLLLAQFSYAAWKGGRADKAWRERAARAKLDALRRQISHLRPAACLAFASFVRFSNQDNAYMNDAVNTPDAVLQALQDAGAPVVFMQPGETQDAARLCQRPESLRFWRDRYAAIAALPLARYGESWDVPALAQALRQYRERMLRRNGSVLMRLARRVLPQRPFAPARVRLTDLGLTVKVDVLARHGMEQVPDAQADVAMHSASLAYVLRHDFGLDTLVVNGCFEAAHPQGFARFAKCMALGSLNAMGVYVGPAILGQRQALALLWDKLRSVRRNAAATRDAGAGD